MTRVRGNASPAAVAALVAAREAGVAQLRATFTGINVVNSPALGTPEVVSVRPGTGFLTAPGIDRVTAMRGFLSTYAGAFGLSQGQVASLEVVADYVNPAGNMAWVELQQRINGVPVFQGRVRGGFTARGELAATTGPLAAGLDTAPLAISPVLTAAQAVSRAAAGVGWNVAENALARKAEGGGTITFARGPMADDAKAWLVYFPIGPGVARLAWATEIWGDPEAFLVLTDAEDGTLLFRKNLTNYQSQTATYVVYADDSPAPMSPSTVLPGSGTQAPFIARTTRTLIGNEAPNTFNDLGWMTDGTNITDGNNVEAGLDLVDPDGVDATVTGVARAFDFAYDPEVQMPATVSYQNGEVTDMFYWTNIYHDRLYLLGFTEAAGNFQNSNFARGGVGGDRISAEAQNNVPACAPAPCVNNANFSTSADGGPGRMQMYTFPGPSPDRSSGLDHDVVLHELTHGTSNRLHNNGSGLTTTMSQGMGEGWSDFYARALLSTADEDPNGIYTFAGWAWSLFVPGYTGNYYYGARRFPYSSISSLGANGKPHNPLTFADIDPAQIDLTDGAYGPRFNSAAFEVHNVGEVWASALLEVRARFITRLGWAVGNQRILQFVTDGMKLDPVNPTMLDGRDSIGLAAVMGGGTEADIADIWAGFAARGMGANAEVLFADGGVVSESFALPGDPAPSFTINNTSVIEGNSGYKTLTFTVTRANPVGPSRVSFATADGTAIGTERTMTSSWAGVTVPSSGAASPYPSTIFVAGLSGTLTNVRVRLNGVSHPLSANLDVLLVGPAGQSVMLMSDVGGTSPNDGVDLTFVDGSPALTQNQLVSGFYAPTDLSVGSADAFPGPAPAGPYGATLGQFNGTDPNGQWSLYVVDDTAEAPALESGSIASFSLTITTSAANDFQGAEGQLVFGSGITTQTIDVYVGGDTAVEPNETFVVNLSHPLNGTIADVQGVGTILDDDFVAPPTVVTQAATSITATGATLNATVNPNGTSTSAVFEYGLALDYGTLAAATTGPGAGTSPVAVNATITGLSCDTPYHFRVSAISSGGTASGSDLLVTTAACLPTVPFSQQGNKLVADRLGNGPNQGSAVSLSADGNTALVGGWGDGIVPTGAAWVWTLSGGAWTQQGPKLVGSGAVGTDARQGYSVSLSADGNTALVGGYQDNSFAGAAWVWTRSDGVWTQQGPKLVGSGAVGVFGSSQGDSVALSADGNTALVGGSGDNGSKGAVWVWTRSGGVWTQQGPKLVGSGSGNSQGYSVAIAADGNTALVGAPNAGAWVWTRTNGVWTEEGPSLVGIGGAGSTHEGAAVAISGDGQTALVGGNWDNSNTGAAWVWTRTGGVWTQQGSKLVGTGAVGAGNQGYSVSLSADGSVALVGGYADNGGRGAAWVWTRTNGVWTQLGSKLAGSPDVGGHQGTSVALAANGRTALVGAPSDNGQTGAAYVFTPTAEPLTELISNPTFGNGTTGWQTYATPDMSYLVSQVTNGVFEYYRVPPPAGTSNQAVVFQETGVRFVANAPVVASFRLGNSSSVRKRISVLLLDSNFSDLSVCTFWLPPNTSLATYQIKSHTTQAWANAAIYFYAASAGQNGGFYQIDNVSVQYAPTESAQQTVCVDPTAPAPPGGVAGPNLLTNGDFGTGTLAPWGTYGTITSQISAGVFEFIKASSTPPAGVVLQATGQAMTAGQILTANFQLGNSSGVRKRVTVLLHDNNFSDLSACTFWLAPGQALSNYALRTFATSAWANATLSVYPATVGAAQWIRLDNATLQRTPAAAITGTACAEPGAAPLAPPPPMVAFTAAAPSATKHPGSRPAAAADSSAPDGAHREPDAPPSSAGPTGSASFSVESGAWQHTDAGEWVATAGESGNAVLQWTQPVDARDDAHSWLQFTSAIDARQSWGEVLVRVAGSDWVSAHVVGAGTGASEITVDLGPMESDFDVQFVFHGLALADSVPDTWQVRDLEVHPETR